MKPTAKSLPLLLVLLMALALATCPDPTTAEITWCLAHARAPRLRTIREFAEAEVVIPDGDFAGLRYKCSRQPYSAHYFAAVDSGRWNRFAACGPVQSGKTLTCFVVPALYHLFEIGESVICGVPTMDIAGDKWREDLLPAIEASRYKDLLPSSGTGSRGGKFESITFRNGATLKYMSGHGGDEKRSAFTARVVICTEVDKFDTAGEASREADPITQLERRTNHFGHRARIYLECTVSIEEGRIWQEFSGGTASRLLLQCPHCGDYVLPEREHLLGHLEAENEVQARENTLFFCPSCAEAWFEEHRLTANQNALLVHKGQTVICSPRPGTPVSETQGRGAGAAESGDVAGHVAESSDARSTFEILGDPPQTYTLGFRWTAAHNLFLTAGDVGLAEFRAKRDATSEDGEKDLRQFYWALPYEPPVFDDTPLSYKAIRQRGEKLPKGLIPRDTTHLSLGIDLGKRLGHWLLVAWRSEHRCHVADYGRFDIASDDIGVELAIPKALRDFRETIETGWTWEAGGARLPDTVWIDSKYQTASVFSFCLEAGPRYYPMQGRAAGQDRSRKYEQPRSTNTIIKEIGEEYHVEWRKDFGLFVMIVNADYWKSWLHQRLATPLVKDGQPQAGALTLYQAAANEHTSLAQHFTSEKCVESFEPGKGRQIKWVRQSRSNHWFDCAYSACAAGSFLGWSLTHEPPPTAASTPAPIVSQFTTPSGAPFVVTER